MKINKSILIPLIVIFLALVFVVNLDRIFPEPKINLTLNESPMGKITASCVNKYNVKDDIVFFYSDYCPHCNKMKPIVKELEGEGYKILWIKNLNSFSKECLSGVMSGFVPEFICLKNSKTLVGEQSKERLKRFFDECSP